MKYIAFFIVVLISSCGSDETENNNAPPQDLADLQQSDLQEVEDLQTKDEEPEYKCPREGELLCGEKCINVAISLDHCGRCNNQCILGRMTCDGNDCVCLKGATFCDGDCWDISTSKTHCGNCDTACTTGEICETGTCVEISSRPVVLEVLKETNLARSKQQDCGVYGLKHAVDPVQLNEKLMVAAQLHSEYQAEIGSMQHEGRNKSAPADRATAQGYDWQAVGENVALNQRTPKEVVAAWIDSDGHCVNVMNGNFDELGVGFVLTPKGERYWTQLFGRQKN